MGHTIPSVVTGSTCDPSLSLYPMLGTFSQGAPDNTLLVSVPIGENMVSQWLLSHRVWCTTLPVVVFIHPLPPQGASDDILATKNLLYQHLTWDPERAVSMCSKLALPLSTPANTSPPPSPKRPAATGGESSGSEGEGENLY